ncbi:hypothetical protein CEXT_785301 [Caerostris extrusa]|uniref:Uncharacterized protein n=1 Tax=Caerostris extrusa TaxID=172846 RepID=A0AAV4TSM4_CAEEX|nr:hypothetical protein CEXT_785301 [Caerostris extrusa]
MAFHFCLQPHSNNERPLLKTSRKSNSVPHHNNKYAINSLRSLGIRVRHAMEKVFSSSPDNNFPKTGSLPGEIQTPGNSGLSTLPPQSLAEHCGSE